MELVLLYLWWCDYWQKQQDDFWSVSGNIICSYFSQMLQNSLDGASQCRWTMTQSILQKQPKSFWRERSGLLCKASQSPDLNPIEHAFHLLKTKLKGKCPKNKQELKTVAVEAWQSITRDETKRLVDVYAFQTSGCNWLQRICNQVLKSESLIYDSYSVPLLWSLNKWEAHMQTVVNSYTVHLIGCKYPQIKLTVCS